jgi:hypothetical protein
MIVVQSEISTTFLLSFGSSFLFQKPFQLFTYISQANFYCQLIPDMMILFFKIEVDETTSHLEQLDEKANKF